jgi:hypothetical protein
LILKTTRAIFGPAPLLLLAGAALLAGLPRPAAADWLLTREGAKVETRGAWVVKGKLVVFTAADGTLSSLRVDQVDLDATRKAVLDKQKMVEEDIARPAEKKKSVRSITDKDVSHPGEAAEAKTDDAKAADGTAPVGAPGAPANPARPKADAPTVNRGAKSPVVVGSWQKLDRAEKDGIELFGDLKNEASEIASVVGLTVTLQDEAGNKVASTEAVLTANAIEPKGATNFRAIFPGVYTFASARFDIRSAPLRLQQAEPKPATAEKNKG